MTRSHHPTRAHISRQPRPVPTAEPAPERHVYTRQQLAGLFGRKTAGENWETIKQRYHGNVPAWQSWESLADRREAARCES